MVLACSASRQPIALDRPGGFAALMELYEHNYIQLRRLAPALPTAGVEQVSRIPGALDLHLRGIEHCRYTHKLLLTYYFRQGDRRVAEPDLRIRIYHDAQLAEVRAVHPYHHALLLRAAPNARHANSPQLLTRWRLNRFLDRWLTYCLRQGHRFPTSPSP